MWEIFRVRSGYRGDAFLTHNTMIDIQTSVDFQDNFA